MKTIEQAIKLATEAHAGQIDKCGEPYIFHPLRVMMTVQGTPIYRVVAVLHDVLEDTDCQIRDLEEHFDMMTIEALKAMTHLGNEPYGAYLQRVKENPIALVVKVADIKDNASPSRLYKLDRDTIQRLTIKYSDALKFLEGY
jgi:(p)ppGpp synthase/HD superfamily hydrolase